MNRCGSGLEESDGSSGLIVFGRCRGNRKQASRARGSEPRRSIREHLWLTRQDCTRVKLRPADRTKAQFCATASYLAREGECPQWELAARGRGIRRLC